MGSSTAASNNQTNGQQQPQKTQKGWLSRWTRKQWSRHWFVLKNGSLTYYRGPAAELCSFLDGVLDLSLIKHIEVPQREEPAAALAHHHRNHRLSSAMISFSGQQQQQQHLNQQQQQHAAANALGQAEQHFNFSLKMWNGECHLLSAASHSERQLWLAAINSCNNYDDDETASSDSSSSSQRSNLSSKSADIGSPHHIVQSIVQVPNQQELQQQPPDQTLATTSKLGVGGHAAANFSLKQQQQQEKEAEISLEQLALKLKSVVRRQASEEEDELDVARHERNGRASNLAPSQTRSKSASSLVGSHPRLASNPTSQQTPTPTTATAASTPSDLMGEESARRASSTSESELCESSDADELERPDSQPTGPETPPVDADQDQARPRKRVTFDFSNQNHLGSSEDTSGGDEESGEESNEVDDDDQEGDEATLSSISTASSSEEDDHEEPRAETGAGKELKAREPSEHTSTTAGSAIVTKRLDMRRRLELREQLRHACKRNQDEDEDSTCELVRRMIERRKLRLQNRDGATGSRLCDRNGERRDSDASDTSSVSSETMSKHEGDQVVGLVSLASEAAAAASTPPPPPPVESRLAMGGDESPSKQQLDSLELRLKSAEHNARALEKRLAESYSSYSRLEMAYKQIQRELIECRELSAKSMLELESKVDELTRELRASELRLLEARSKLLEHEEHLAKWQPPSNSNDNTQSTPTAPQHSQAQLQQTSQQASTATNKKTQPAGSNNWPRLCSSSVLSLGQTNKLLLNLAHQQLRPAAYQLSQQHLGLKLLSQSKQIQRKLNELELKVDQIQSQSRGPGQLGPSGGHQTTGAAAGAEAAGPIVSACLD